MPEKRLVKTRRSLPVGYQYLDAGDGARVILLEADEFIAGTLPPKVTVQYQPTHQCVYKWPRDANGRAIGNRYCIHCSRSITIKGESVGWNTIEAEEHGDEWAV